FSSYDRTGGNNDGFNGTYSRIRAEDGNSVLAEVDGPGVVQRIWFTHTSGEQPGLLDRKQEHVKIYLDGRDRPALDVPLETIFSGTHPTSLGLSSARDPEGSSRTCPFGSRKVA